jgi:tyrosyl-tRNA synthetase
MRVDTSKIIPQTILNNQEYHDKLQQLAMYADMGDHKRMQQVLDNKKVMERKNLLLQPIFRDLKS